MNESIMKKYLFPLMKFYLRGQRGLHVMETFRDFLSPKTSWPNILMDYLCPCFNIINKKRKLTKKYSLKVTYPYRKGQVSGFCSPLSSGRRNKARNMKRVSRKLRSSSLGYIKNRNGKVKSSGMCAMLKFSNIVENN